MHVDIISVQPDLLTSPFSHSILKRAADKGHLTIEVHQLKDYSEFKHNQVDDYQFGGGAGMVMMCEPLANCIDTLSKKGTYDAIIYLTPEGETFKQTTANQFSLMNRLLLICGHYKGIDQRIRDAYVTHEISIGDYVLSGGELAAAVVVDAVGRLIPGVLNNETSALTDSFQDNLLAPPIYTRPAVWRDRAVPEVLLSGHQANIENWRTEQAYQNTKNRRPDLLEE